MPNDPSIKDPQLSPDFPDSFYRVAVKGLCVREGRVLLCEDFSVPREKGSAWELPGGGLDFGEAFADGLAREVKEEMGLEVAWISERPSYLWTYRIEKHRGMNWWYVLLIAYQFELKDLNFTPSDECRAIKFFSKEELETADDLNDQIQPFAKLFNPKDFK